MVALVEHIKHGIVGVHRTYLTSDHRRRDRASLGAIGGGAVRLGEVRADTELCIAEGIETALAVMTACGMPAWAALSAGGIRALVLPPEASRVVIAADHDASGVGQNAALDAAARWLAEGRRVHIAMPPKPGADFNDVLTDCAAAKINEARHVA
jgi:putative DNA primase/helicase